MHLIFLEVTIILNQITRRICLVVLEVSTLARQCALFGFDLWAHMLTLEFGWNLISVRIFFKPTLRIRLYILSNLVWSKEIK